MMAGCLLLALYLFVRLCYIEEIWNSHFLAVIPGISTGDQPTTQCASEGKSNPVTERNNLTVNKVVISSALGPPEQSMVKYCSDVNNTSVLRGAEKVSFSETGHASLRELDTEPVPGERHIIFLETRCVLNDSKIGNQSGLAINQRQACAVASAANTNPDTKVYLLYTCSVIGNLGDSPAYVKQMLSYPNVRIWKLVISDYIKRTPLENWDFMRKIQSSHWPVVHASDILRYLTLWKYGGTYLDMDFVIRRSLVELGTNYAGAESERDMGNAALSFDVDTAGRTAVNLMLSDVQMNFNGKMWGHNGPKLVRRVLQIMCGIKHVTNGTRQKCSGVAVLPPSVFYSVYYESWKLFFDASRSDEVLKQVEGSYGVHLWNKKSSKEKITVGSKQAYGLLAEKHCPRVYSNCGPVF